MATRTSKAHEKWHIAIIVTCEGSAIDKSKNKIIMLEFNELVPELMSQFIDRGLLPHFENFRNEAFIFETDATVEDGIQLAPWVQWVTIHTGQKADDHGVLKLSEGHGSASHAIWDVLSENKISSWICGAMNARCNSRYLGHLLPDPWSMGSTPYPKTEFVPYLKFIRHVVQEHTNPSYKFSLADVSRFVFYMLRRGLSLTTIRKTLWQVLSERFAKTKWKRVSIMDLFQFDLFEYFYTKHKPQFAVFYSNSTAHLQHRYWRNMEPECFTIPPGVTGQHQLESAIQCGYQAMDDLVGRAIRMADEDTTLLFCTGLSQRAFVEGDREGGKAHYRIHSERIFSDTLNIRFRFKYEPVMAEQFYLNFNSVENCTEVKQYLSSLRVLGEHVFDLTQYNEKLYVGCRIFHHIPGNALIESDHIEQSIEFANLFYKVDGLKSGCHDPRGMLWVRHPHKTHQNMEHIVCNEHIAQAILRLFDISTPKTMEESSLCFASQSMIQ